MSSSTFSRYLLPSIPFCRQKSNNISPGFELSVGNEQHKNYLNGAISWLRCARCTADLCSSSQIISKGFTGRHGQAYLVSGSLPDGFPHASRPSKASTLPNTRIHKPVSRQLVTGAHTVSDVSCVFCASVVGWKYDAAEEESQRYKVGNFILETKRIYSASSWESREWNESWKQAPLDGTVPDSQHKVYDNRVESNIDFDSQDEDECEDLFAGIWNPSLAIRRRQGKKFGRTITQNADLR